MQKTKEQRSLGLALPGGGGRQGYIFSCPLLGQLRSNSNIWTVVSNTFGCYGYHTRLQPFPRGVCMLLPCHICQPHGNFLPVSKLALDIDVSGIELFLPFSEDLHCWNVSFALCGSLAQVALVRRLLACSCCGNLIFGGFLYPDLDITLLGEPTEIPSNLSHSVQCKIQISQRFIWKWSSKFEGKPKILPFAPEQIW